MVSSVSLSLFGVIHMDDRSKVTRELEDTATDADAICIEYPATRHGVRDVLELFARVPMYTVGAAVLQALLFSPLFLLFNRDLFPTELVAARTVTADRDVPLHAVDEHPNQQLLDAGPKHVLVNYLLIAPAIAYAPVAATLVIVALVVTGFLPSYLRRRTHRYVAFASVPLGVLAFFASMLLTWATAWLVLVGALVATASIRRSIDRRNEVMVDRVQALAAEHGYDDVVLVTGKGHLGGIATLALDHGFTIPSIHVSYWRSSGETHHDVAVPRPVDGERAPEGDSGRLDPGDVTLPGDLELPSGEDFRSPPRTVEGSETQVLGRRAAAAVVDAAIVGALWFLNSLLLGFWYVENEVAMSDAAFGFAVIGIWIAVVIGYHALLEWRRGATLGKYVLGVVVVDETGGLLTKRAVIARNVLRPFGLATGYLTAFVTVLVDGRNRTLGDRLGGSYVLSRDTSDEAATVGDATDADDADGAVDAGGVDDAVGTEDGGAVEEASGGDDAAGAEDSAIAAARRDGEEPDAA